jgi:pimeloyl-ACP methyl ester carboxylesterase
MRAARARCLLLALVFMCAAACAHLSLAARAKARRDALTRAGFSPFALDGTPALVGYRAGAGRTLLFLHGTGDQAGSWAAVAPHFRDRWLVVLADLPGHSGSAPAEGELAMATLVAGAERFLLETKGDGRTTIVGNSLGAWLATLLAERHPDLVERLVLINGGALMGEAPKASFLPKTREDAARLMALTRDPGSPKLEPAHFDELVANAPHSAMSRLSRDAAGLVMHLRGPAQLGKITVPVELVWGVSDQIVPLAYAERLVAAFPNVRLRRVEKCGHVPQIECPARLRAALEEVLAR